MNLDRLYVLKLSQKMTSQMTVTANLSRRRMMQKYDEYLMGPVVRRKRDADGNLIENPLLSTVMYEIEFAVGTIEPYAANIIAEHIWTQVDDHGHDTIILDEIIDHDIDEKVAFKVTEDSGNKPIPGHNRITCHLVFDVKMDFTRKA